MRTMYPIALIVIALVSWVNWWFLTKWFPNLHSRLTLCTYWLVNAFAWFTIGYSWLVHPGTPLFYQWITPFLYVSFVWIVAEGILLLLFPILFAVRKMIHYDNMPTRRTFLQKIVYVAPALAFGVSAQGVYSSRFDMAVRRLELTCKGLPRQLTGFKIAQISDTHLGPFFSLDRLDDVIALIKQEKPDMVVITGDLIDDLNLVKPAIGKLSQLAALIPYGIYFCWGNHEYFRDIQRIRDELLKSPIHILENSNAPIVVGDTTFYMLGVDYPWADTIPEKTEKQQQLLTKAQTNIPDNAFRILLAHHPDFFSDAFAANIPLTLSGHTHGGQINVFGYPLLPLKYRYMRGLYEDNQNYGYVNVGAGQWFPFRLGCPPEISVFTLV